jgi:oxalate decarboxylase/phosphoglucose isomerase-like protein (cupin superfamily)
MKVRVLDPFEDGKQIWLGDEKGMVRKVFRTIDRDQCNSEYFVSGITYFEPGESSSLHNHPNSEEIDFIIQGSGVVESDNETLPFKSMQYMFIPKGVMHRHYNTGRDTMILLWTYTPPGELPKD